MESTYAPSMHLTIGIEALEAGTVTQSFDDIISAIIQLAEHSGEDLLKLASEGRLREVFPYRLRASEDPPLKSWDDIEEAPARPLADAEYRAFLRRR